MKSVKKLFSLLLCIAMLVGTVGLVSCNNEEIPDSTTAAETTAEPPAERIKLVENGKAAYTIIYPTGADGAVLTAMNALIKKIEDATGVKLPTKSDYLRPGQTRDPEAKELLFGQTCLDESQAELAKMYSDEYVIKAVGKKVLFLSPNNSYLLAAVNYYTKNLLKKNLEETENGKTLYFEEYHFIAEGADKTLSINGQRIDRFSIIYDTDDGYKEVAELLSQKIAQYTGYSLPIYADTAKAASDASCEILIGETNRALSKACYKDTVDLLTYKVVIEGNFLQIVSGGSFSARDCANSLAITFFANPGKHVSGTYLEKDLKASNIPALTNGADLRIMTSNMLSSWWGENSEGGEYIPPVSQRAEIAAAVLALYQPDVVGLQEVNSPWIKALNQYAPLLKERYGITYSLHLETYQKKSNLTALLYRSDKLSVVESGVAVFSYWSPTATYHMRNVTWAHFKAKDGSTEFIHANTHWGWNEYSDSGALTGNDGDLSGEDAAKSINILKARFNLPIFCTGDYNSKPEDANMLYYLSTAGMQSLRLQAKDAGVLANKISGCGTVGSNRGEGNYIDHITGSGSYTVLRYETVVGSMAHWMSDHAPQFADVKLK